MLLLFHLQVLALVIDPTNFNESKYPEDAKQRAQAILDGCGGKSVGSYSDSSGIEIIRRHAAEYIQNRDGMRQNLAQFILKLEK